MKKKKNYDKQSKVVKRHIYGEAHGYIYIYVNTIKYFLVYICILGSTFGTWILE